jgi:mannose-6-phosphate isomerase-like protein (cupin superfamily)
MATNVIAKESNKIPRPEMATGAQKFSMRGAPLLSSGASYDALSSTDNLWLSLKVYSSGGENALHYHSQEDHAFVVLQGRATFHLGDGSTIEALPYEGVMLPKNTVYKFEAGEEENLVLLRIGGGQRKDLSNRKLQRHGAPAELAGTTFDADHSIKVGSDPKTGTPSEPIVPIPGKFFPKDF